MTRDQFLALSWMDARMYIDELSIDLYERARDAWDHGSDEYRDENPEPEIPLALSERNKKLNPADNDDSDTPFTDISSYLESEEGTVVIEPEEDDGEIAQDISMFLG